MSTGHGERPIEFRAIIDESTTIYFTLRILANGLIPTIKGVLIPRLLSGNIPDQRTGLCDKNGTKIYERDIYKISRDLTLRIVTYNDCHGGWDRAYAIEEIGDIPSKEYEVIGNVYRNTDLLSE